MGAAARWFRALIGIKKSKAHGGKDDLKSSTAGKSKRWLVRRLGMGKSNENTSHHNVNDFITVESSNRFDVPRTPIHDTRPLEARMQVAAIKIQCGFRRFLARRAYRALRALVRIQAIFRGNLVRKQIRRSVNKHLCYFHAQLQGFSADNKKKAWCDCQGTLQEINARLQRRQDATMNRERALVYALSHQFTGRKALSKKCWQPWDAGLVDPTLYSPSKKPLRVQIAPQIAISYYYSGPIFASSPSVASSCSHAHNAMHVHCHMANDMYEKKPGYMETTISMQAKHRNLSNTNLQHSFPAIHRKRRHTSVACLDNHQLLQCC